MVILNSVNFSLKNRTGSTGPTSWTVNRHQNRSDSKVKTFFFEPIKPTVEPIKSIYNYFYFNNILIIYL